MAEERRGLRRIGDTVLAAGPADVRIRTRIHLTEAEAAAVAAIGSFLGSVFRAELVGRVDAGRLDRHSQARWRAQRKRAVTALASSRWAGAITRPVDDRYQLGMRGVSAHVSDLRHGVEVEARCALRPGEQEASPLVRVGVGVVTARPVSGSRKPGAWRSCVRDSPSRRKALDAGRPSLTMGGKRLWRNRTHLDQAGITEQQWRARWDAARMFLTADGESGKAGGNETIRVVEAGSAADQGPGRPGRPARHLCAHRRAGHVRASQPAVGRAGRGPPCGALRHHRRPGHRPLVSGRVLETGRSHRGALHRRSAHRPGGGCRSQRRSPGLLCVGRIRQPGRGPDHHPRRHRRFRGIAA